MVFLPDDNSLTIRLTNEEASEISLRGAASRTLMHLIHDLRTIVRARPSKYDKEDDD